jgi:hypothetical protein
MAAGFSEAKPIGFAAHAQPSYSFARYLDGDNRVSLREKPTPRARRFDAPKTTAQLYPWPGMVVVRKIDAPEANKRWRPYYEKVESSARRIGRAVGYRNIRCELVTQAELHSALNEYYADAAHDPIDSRRNGIADKFIGKLNGLLEQMQKDTFDTKEEELWTPLIFEVGEQEGVGPNGIGVSLVDENHSFARASTMVVDRLTNGLGLNPVHFRPSTEPRILFVDTSPLPVDGLRYSLPKDMPIDLPLKAPRAYLTGNL